MGRTQSRILPWFGSDASVCEHHARLLADCKHVTVLMVGGGSILSYLAKTAREIVCNDKHSLAINLFRVISDRDWCERLIQKLYITPFHEEVLAEAQLHCKNHQKTLTEIDPGLAFSYFVTCWMGRSGKSGTNSELNGKLALRWDAGGGSSPLRFRTAVKSLQEVWGPICERCSFVCRDWTEIINNVKDSSELGCYIDGPWPEDGDDYLHTFRNPQDHIRLRNELLRFSKTKIVIRYGDKKLVRDLYSESRWHIQELGSRDQANGSVKELCITNFS